MATSQHDAPYNVTARYPDMAQARRAVEGLEEQGVEAATISLTGDAAREANAQSTQERDRKFLDHTTRAAKKGALIGSGVGLLAGLLAGLLIAALTGEAMPEGMAIVAFGLGGAAAGFGVGLLVSFLTNQKQSGAWETSMADVEGSATVGVHTGDPNVYATAVQTLQSTNPQHLQRFDAQGHPLNGREGTARGTAAT